MCDIYNDFTTHGLNVMSLSFSEKCLVCLLGDNLENTIESRERTRARHNTQKSSHPNHHSKPAEDRPTAALLGFPQPPLTAARFLLPCCGPPLLTPRILLTPGVVMWCRDGCVCVWCLSVQVHYFISYGDVFFLCRRESAKGNKNKTERPTVVPVPAVQIQ